MIFHFYIEHTSVNRILLSWPKFHVQICELNYLGITLLFWKIFYIVIFVSVFGENKNATLLQIGPAVFCYSAPRFFCFILGKLELIIIISEICDELKHNVNIIDFKISFVKSDMFQ
jgi:hypothetical protein